MQAAALMKIPSIDGLPVEWRRLPKGTKVKIMETTTSKVTTIRLAGPEPSAMGQSSPPVGHAKGRLLAEGALQDSTNVRPS